MSRLARKRLGCRLDNFFPASLNVYSRTYACTDAGLPRPTVNTIDSTEYWFQVFGIHLDRGMLVN